MKNERTTQEPHTTAYSCQMSIICEEEEEEDRGGMKDPPFCLNHPRSQVEEGCLQVELSQGKGQGGPVNLGRLQGGG